MEVSLDRDALALAGGRAVLSAWGRLAMPGHDIPQPIGDPDEDEELPGDDEEEDDEDDEEPLQV